MKKTILCLALVALSVIGCKKEEVQSSDDSTSLLSSPKVLTEIEYLENDGISSDTAIKKYEYDSKGRVISEIQLATFSNYSINYKYLSLSKIYVIMHYHNDGMGTIDDTFYLNLDQNGRAISFESSVKTEGYSYSPEGFLNNNNKVMVVKDENVIKHDDKTYEYFLDKISTIRHINYGINFLGKDSKNLVKSEISSSNGNVKNYSYEFDSKNRVIKEIITEIDSQGSVNNSKKIRTFQYN